MDPFLLLPEEILVKIANYLDGRSLVSFINSHRRISAVSGRILDNFRVKRLDAPLVDLFSIHGVDVRRLDLNYCSAESALLESVISSCKSLRELSVVNTRLSLRQIMAVTGELVHLKKLSLTIRNSDAESHASIPFHLNTNVERLYIEVTCDESSFSLMAKLVNSCENIRWLHLFFFREMYGASRGPSFEPVIKHIETVIISLGSAWKDHSIPRFFPHLRNNDQIYIDYIEFNGFNNSMKQWQGRNVPPNIRKSPLLESWIVDCDIPDVPGHGRRLDCVLGNPKRLVIFNWGLSASNLHLDRSLADHLVELNLKFVHWHAYGKDVYRILSSTTSLRALALTSCTLMAGLENASVVDEERPSVWKAMARLNLRELYVNGRPCKNFLNPCVMPSFIPGFDPMEGMSFDFKFEELNLRQARLPLPLMRKLACPTLKHVKITSAFREYLSHTVELADFLRHCPSLRSFKLDDAGSLQSKSLWEALVDCSNLKELCLKRKQGGPCDVPLMVSCIKKMQNLEVLYLVSSNGIYLHEVYEPDILKIPGIRSFYDCERGGIFISEKNLGSFPDSRIGYQFGRRAFNSECYVGFLRPEGWC